MGSEGRKKRDTCIYAINPWGRELKSRIVRRMLCISDPLKCLLLYNARSPCFWKPWSKCCNINTSLCYIVEAAFVIWTSVRRAGWKSEILVFHWQFGYIQNSHANNDNDDSRRLEFMLHPICSSWVLGPPPVRRNYVPSSQITPANESYFIQLRQTVKEEKRGEVAYTLGVSLYSEKPA